MARDPLVDFLRKRSRRRFAALVQATRDDVLNAAYRVTGNQHLAEDVAQDVFVRLLTARWDPERIRCGKALLISTAVLTALMRARAEDRRVHRERQAAEPLSAPELAMSREEILDIRDAILDLPQVLQACVDLRYYGGLSILEIAIALGCSQGAVKARLAKARAILRDRLSPPTMLLLFPVLAREGKAAIATISASPSLRRELSRLAWDGPVMAAIAAGVAPAAGVKAVAWVPFLLLLATAGGWLLVPTNPVREGRPHETPKHGIALLPVAGSGTAPETALAPIVVKRALVIDFRGDGLNWPPEMVRVRLSGPEVDRSWLSEKGAPVSMDIPSGAYTVEADGRPHWSRESLSLAVDAVAPDPQPVTVTLTDSFDLEGCARDPGGNGLASCVINVLGPELEEICTVTTSDMRNAFRRPPIEPYEFRIHLPLGSVYELRVLHSLNLYEPLVTQIENEDGLRRLRRDLILQPAGPPLRLLLRGCDGKLLENARLAQVNIDRGIGWHCGYGVLVEDRRDDGTFLLRTFPRDAPFPLFVNCVGYAPTQVLADPSRLPDPLEVRLDCSQVFYGLVQPAKPRNSNWGLSVEGPTLLTGTQAVDERGRFSVSAPDLKDVTVEVHGLGYHRLITNLSQPSSPDEPAVIRPESFGDGDAQVRLSVENEQCNLSRATVTLEPSKQDYSNLYRAYSLPFSFSELVFDGVLPGYYDVKVRGADGQELAQEERRLVRAPKTALHIAVDRTLCVVQVRNRRVLGDVDLLLKIDGEPEVEVPPLDNATLELPTHQGWHQVEVWERTERLLYRGYLDLRAEPPTVFDLSQTFSIAVRRNGRSAPLSLRGTSGNLSDSSKNVGFSFPLDPGADVTRLTWILGPRTNISLEGEYGYFFVNPSEDHELRIAIGRQGELTIPLERRNDEGRCFLLGRIAEERAIYWALAPARSGDSLVVPLETELSRWALLQYRSRRLEHVIADEKSVEQVVRRIHVIAADGSPAQGASVRIRGKSLLGLELGDYFQWDSKDFFFTLGEGSTDADGYAVLDTTGLEETEVVVNHMGLKSVRTLLKDLSTFSMKLTESAVHRQ